ALSHLDSIFLSRCDNQRDFHAETIVILAGRPHSVAVSCFYSERTHVLFKLWRPAFSCGCLLYRLRQQCCYRSSSFGATGAGQPDKAVGVDPTATATNPGARYSGGRERLELGCIPV